MVLLAGLCVRVSYAIATVRERFERCLDLYLCPRTKRTRLDIDPESLVPKLPKPRELRPFPSGMNHLPPVVGCILSCALQK